jgi:hypothetical protein
MACALAPTPSPPVVGSSRRRLAAAVRARAAGDHEGARAAPA